MAQVDPVVSWVIALSVAFLFGTAATHKLRAWTKFREVVRNYQLLPHGLVPVVATLLAAFELCSVLLILPIATRPIGALLAAGLLVGYATAIAINLGRGRVNLDCGCLGISRRQAVRWWMVWRNLVIAGLAMVTGLPTVSRELSALDGFTIVCATISFAFLYAAQDLLGAAARPLSR